MKNLHPTSSEQDRDRALNTLPTNEIMTLFSSLRSQELFGFAQNKSKQHAIRMFDFECFYNG